MKRIRFEADDDGLVVVDDIEGHQDVMSMTEEVTPEPTEGDFRFPVDTTVSILTSGFTVVDGHILVRDRTTEEIISTYEHGNEEFDHSQYEIEITVGAKLYINIESAVEITINSDEIEVDFGTVEEVVIGARSPHNHPATTVTTTTDPKDMMQAVSTFGSALKTTSPERSYPTLRGHPPTIEVGDELDLAGLEPPDTGVTIEVPPEHSAIFVVAPLAYYLGARVVPGEKPLLRTDEGFKHELKGKGGFKQAVERTFKQIFFLDCLTRTEGQNPTDLHSRSVLDDDLGLDFAALYDRSLAEQLEAYLQIPYQLLESHIPRWKLTSHIEPDTENIETLPFVVDDLAVIRSSQPQKITNASRAMLNQTLRGFSRSTTTQTTDETYVQLGPSESVEQAWIGDGLPLDASKATTKAYRNRLEQTPTETSINIIVVCNDTAMDEERGIINEIYGREELPFSVIVKSNLTTKELEDVLVSENDLLHYIGHISPEGFQCCDGKFDAGTLDSVGTSAFLLNGCQSYRQGMALIEQGAIGGAVTLADVLNRDAVTMGRTFAGLLNFGFPMRAALDISRDVIPAGSSQYVVIGDGNVTIAHAEGGTPNICEIERTGDSFDVQHRMFPTRINALGSTYTEFVNNEKYLSSGTIDTYEMSVDELEEFFDYETLPVKIDGELYWSDRFDLREHYDIK